MCVAAKGRLQGRAATLLLLWAGFSIFFFVFMQQKFNFHSVVCFFTMNANGHLQVVVADFEERQCPIKHDSQERSGDNAPHEPRNAIYNLLPNGF